MAFQWPAIARGVFDIVQHRGATFRPLSSNGTRPLEVHVRYARSTGRYTVTISRSSSSFRLAFTADSVWIGSGVTNAAEVPTVEGMSNSLCFTSGNRLVVVCGVVYTMPLRDAEQVVQFVGLVGPNRKVFGYVETTLGIYVLGDMNCSTGFIPLTNVEPAVESMLRQFERAYGRIHPAFLCFNHPERAQRIAGLEVLSA